MLFPDSIWQHKGIYEKGESNREENKELWEAKLPFTYTAHLCTCVNETFLNTIWTLNNNHSYFRLGFHLDVEKTVEHFFCY